MNGYYAVYYTGQTGSAAFGFVMKDGKVLGVDATGGRIGGTYTRNEDGSVKFDITFTWLAGTHLVTGQVLQAPMTMPATFTASSSMMSGAVERIQLPIGAVNARLERLIEL